MDFGIILKKSNLVKDQLFSPWLFLQVIYDNTEMSFINMNRIQKRVIEFQIKRLRNELANFEE